MVRAVLAVVHNYESLIQAVFARIPSLCIATDLRGVHYEGIFYWLLLGKNSFPKQATHCCQRDSFSLTECHADDAADERARLRQIERSR